MSNLWCHDKASEAASVGSFAIWSKPAPFRPWANQADPTADPHDEHVTEATVAGEIDAFAEGFEAGRRTVEQEIAQERQAVAALAEALQSLQPEPTAPLAALLAQAVDRLVRQIVGEVEIDRDLLLRRAEAAANLIGEETAPTKLRVHPEDAAVLEGAQLPVTVVPDASLVRGEIVLETATGWIEDGPAVRLERMRAELDRMGLADA